MPDSDLFFNRELSWLAFNDRVLQLAEDALGAADGAAEVLRHLRAQPGRVLHDPRGAAARAERGARGAAGAGRGHAGGDAGQAARERPRAGPAPQRLLRAGAAARAGGEGPAHPLHEGAGRGGAGAGGSALPRADLPGAHAAGDRAGAALPLHLQPLAEPGGAAAGPGGGGGERGAGEGAQGAAAALRAAQGGQRAFVPLEDIIAATWGRCSRGWRCWTTACSG